MKDNHAIKIMSDGFVWRILTAQEARALRSTEAFEIYCLHSDDTESLIENDKEFECLVENAILGIEVGFIKNAMSCK